MSNTHIMVDIETLGTSPKSVIFSIAAIKIKSNKIAGEFIAHPSVESGTGSRIQSAGRYSQMVDVPRRRGKRANYKQYE